MEPAIAVDEPILLSWFEILRVCLLAVAMSACSGVPQGTVVLPTDARWSGGCAVGVGLDAILHGSRDEPRVTWAIDRFSGTRVDIVWPAGYSARFLPDLQVLDGTGAVVAREGDLIVGTCGGDPARVDAGEVRPPTWEPGDG